MDAAGSEDDRNRFEHGNNGNHGNDGNHGNQGDNGMTNGMTNGSDMSELDELLGAYALDAVSASEARRVEEYLTVNPKAAAEVREHREVATMLAFTGMDAPVGLWSKIVDELDAPAPQPGPVLAKVLSIDEPRRRRRVPSMVPWLASAAAAIVAVVAIGIADRASAPGDPIVAAFATAQADRDSAGATLVAEGSEAAATAVIDQDGHGYVDADDLPPLGPDQTYQLWGVVDRVDADPDVISLGILGPKPGLETFTTGSTVVALAITIEDAPGVISNGNPSGMYVGELV